MADAIPKCTRVLVTAIYADGSSAVIDIPEPKTFAEEYFETALARLTDSGVIFMPYATKVDTDMFKIETSFGDDLIIERWYYYDSAIGYLVQEIQKSRKLSGTTAVRVWYEDDEKSVLIHSWIKGESPDDDIPDEDDMHMDIKKKEALVAWTP